MKAIFVILLSAIFTLSLGIESHISAHPSEGIVLKSNRVNGYVGTNNGGDKVFAEFRNYTDRTVGISWRILARDKNGNTEEVASGYCTVEPNGTHRTDSYSKKYYLYNYRVEWSQD